MKVRSVVFLQALIILIVLAGFSPVLSRETDWTKPAVSARGKAYCRGVGSQNAQVIETAETGKTVRDVLNLDLEKAVDIAVANNPQLKAAEAQVRQAHGEYLEARSALNFKFNISGTYTRIDPVTEAEFSLSPGMPTQKIKLGSNDNYSAKAVLQKIITTFGKIEYKIAAAYLQVEVYRQSYNATRQNVIFKTKQGYFQVLRAMGLVRVARENVEIAQKQLKVTRDMFEAGIVPRFDVLRAQLAVSRARQGLIKAQNGRDLAISSLLNVLGKDLETKVNLSDEKDFDEIEVNLDKAQELAIKNRPEVRAARLSYQSVKFLEESAKRGKSPTLLFTSSFENKTTSAFSSTPNTWAQMLVLSVPIFDGGETKAKIKQAKAQLDNLKNTIAFLYQNIQLEVKQAVLNLEEISAKLEAARKDLETARERHSIAVARYENGISTSLELDDARRELNAAKINYVNLQYEYKIAVAKLEKATATSWKGDTQDEE